MLETLAISTPPLREFKTSADIIDLFQEQLDRFPLDPVTGHRRYTELGGYMIRPREVEALRLTHFVFPSTIIGIPGAGRSMRAHSDLTNPQAFFLACDESNDLWLSVTADHLTEDGLAERVCLILDPDQYVLNAPVWNYFDEAAQANLQSSDLNASCSPQTLTRYIKNKYSWSAEDYLIDEKEKTFIRLPVPINTMGSYGTLSSYHQSPRFVASVINESQYTDDDEFFQVGSAHIHPEHEFQGISEQVASRIGEYKAQMTLSPADIRVLVGSIDAYNKINDKVTGSRKETAESFVSILGVNKPGQITAIQHHDLGLIDNMDELIDLNERTLQSFSSPNPDIGLIVAHYEFLNDPGICSSDFPTGDIGDHLGSI